MGKEAFKAYDSHLHMGFISDNEVILPSDIKCFIKKQGVSGGAIMPTACKKGDDNFEFHIDLYNQAILEGFSLILYVTPRIIELIKNQYTSLLDTIHFSGIKIHPDAVKYTQQDLMMITKIAHLYKFPIFIHTGGKTLCEAMQFEKTIKLNPDILFVLCHARPANQAFYLLDTHPNVWIDTAFLPIEELINRVNSNNKERILFGTDFPVNLWYPELPESNTWYTSQITDIVNYLPKDTSADILHYNYTSFFIHGKDKEKHK